jgi:N-glycosylase/DNA lyase
MTQEISVNIAGNLRRLSLPDSDRQVLPGVRWGHHYSILTPAFWAAQAWLDEADNAYSTFRIGETLEEEVAACLLGGHGIPAEIGLAAFYRVRDCGLLTGKPPSETTLYQTLSEPLSIGSRKIRYRFAYQRSKYLSAALCKLYDAPPPMHDDLTFRQWLLGLSGIGPKTASWITRNWLESDRVAIIDIHIHRAGLLMGLYNQDESPAKHYFGMEQKFLAFASCIGVKASILDALIWRHMKDAGNLALDLIKRIRG